MICAHLGLPWAQGGILGVGVFFTLSGFLITMILAKAFQERGNLRLRTFWLRRARRLLPAVVVLLVVVLISTAMLDPDALATRGRDAVAALFYVANWNTIGQAYVAANTAATNPLEHLWSLSVEEQFYLVWPLLGLFLFVCRGRLRIVAALTALLAAASFALCWLLFSPGVDGATRAYEGTDTRAGALLVGAVAALWWRSAPRGLRTKRSRTIQLDSLALLALLGIGVLAWKTDQFSALLYPWGFLALSVATTVLLPAVVRSGSVLGARCRLLADAVDRRTLLRHLLLRHLSLADACHRLLTGAHRPQRVGTGRRQRRRDHRTVRSVLVADRRSDPAPRVPGRVPSSGRDRGCGGRLTRRSCAAQPSSGRCQSSAARAVPDPLSSADSDARKTGCEDQRARCCDAHPRGYPQQQCGCTCAYGTPSPATHAGPLRSSCQSVLYIGDSTSEGVISTNYLPAAADREKAQLHAIGVTSFIQQISGARAIVEHYKGEMSGMDVVDKYVARGFHGCWIIALGNNDAANISIGARPDARGRVDTVMKKIGDQPVLWVNTRTLVTRGPNAESNVLSWDGALTQACTRYPDLRIYDWASEVKPDWCTHTDNIHYTTPGYRARSRGIARATAIAFPAKGEKSANCLVSSR